MGGEVYLAEYGRAKTIHFDLVEVDGVDLRVDAADAGADCIVMTDEAAEGTATNDFVDEGTGYSLVLTAAEMAGARITVYVIDSATKVWLDKAIHIETFGHLSSAHPFLSPYWTNGAVNDGSASSTVWTFDGFTEATADHVIGSELTFTSGANAGQTRTVTDYTSTVITVSPAFLAAPADNDEFVLRAVAQTTLGIGQAPSIGDILADVTGIAGSAMRGTDSAATEAKQDIIDTNVDDIESLLRTLSDAFVLTSAVIETVTSQTQFVIPATVDATDNQAYHGALAVFIDGTDPNQKSFRIIETYTASSRTVVVSKAPDFTITTSDTITILATTDAGGVWDMILTGAKHNINTSAGKRLRQLEQALVFASGTVDTVTDGRTITLDTGAVGTADFYEHARLQITEGTGAGQSRIIVGYTAGRVATLDSVWETNPDTSSLYEIVAADVHVSVMSTDLAVGLVATATSTTQITLDDGALANADYYNEMLIVFTHGTGAGQATHITAYTAGRVATLSPALDTALSTDTIYHIQAVVPISQQVKEVWDEAMVASTGAPAITGSMRAFMEWWATLSRNVVNQTATTTTVRNDADDGDIATSTVSDDGTTFVRGEFST